MKRFFFTALLPAIASAGIMLLVNTYGGKIAHFAPVFGFATNGILWGIMQSRFPKPEKETPEKNATGQ